MLSVLLIQPMGPLGAAIRRCNGRLRMLPYVMRVGVGSGDLCVVGVIASPLASARLRDELLAKIPK